MARALPSPPPCVEACLVAGNQGPGLTINGLPTVILQDCRVLANGTGPVDALRAQVTASGGTSLRLASCVLASTAGNDLLRVWDPARVVSASDCAVWGGAPPGPGFTALATQPTWAVPAP